MILDISKIYSFGVIWMLKSQSRLHIIRNMEMNRAVIAFAALAQATRLRTLQLLVGRDGRSVRAGEIAEALSIPTNTMSTHLAILGRAGLVTSTRNGREVRYAADPATVSRLLGFAETTLLPDAARCKDATG
jgi:ArsR family transcriptional regulator